MKVERWGPGLHMELPKHSLHTSLNGPGVTLTLEESRELVEKMLQVIWDMAPETAAQRQRVDAPRSTSAKPSDG